MRRNIMVIATVALLLLAIAIAATYGFANTSPSHLPVPATLPVAQNAPGARPTTIASSIAPTLPMYPGAQPEAGPSPDHFLDGGRNFDWDYVIYIRTNVPDYKVIEFYDDALLKNGWNLPVPGIKSGHEYTLPTPKEDPLTFTHVDVDCRSFDGVKQTGSECRIGVFGQPNQDNIPLYEDAQQVVTSEVMVMSVTLNRKVWAYPETNDSLIFR